MLCSRVRRRLHRIDDIQHEARAEHESQILIILFYFKPVLLLVVAGVA